MKIVAVNDTNIIIDLFNVGLLDMFLSSNIELHTTDFVINEIVDVEQTKIVEKYINNGNLFIKEFSGDEMESLFTFQSIQTSNVSVTDCSVWKYALENEYVLLTGDGNLRRDALANGVVVRGILYVFDLLIDARLLSFQLAIEKLKELLSNNVRLPKSACISKIEMWENLSK